MIPFKNRFHGHKSLGYVYRNGQAARSHLMTFKFVANPRRKDSRVAVVVSKKTLKSAVRRNRVRRRIYECIRPDLPTFHKIYDMVFIVTSSEIESASPVELSNLINQLFDQTGIKKNPQ